MIKHGIRTLSTISHIIQFNLAPIYLGQRENELAAESTEAYQQEEHGCFTSPNDRGYVPVSNEEDIRVNQDETSVCMEYPEDMSPEQVTEAEACAILFALDGYTYNNIVEEGSEEYCNSSNKGDEDANDDLVVGGRGC